MKKNDKKELSEKTLDELKKTLVDLRKEFFELSIEKEQGRLANTSSLTNTRKKIAFLNTIINQKEKTKNV